MRGQGDSGGDQGRRRRGREQSWLAVGPRRGQLEAAEAEKVRWAEGAGRRSEALGRRPPGPGDAAGAVSSPSGPLGLGHVCCPGPAVGPREAPRGSELLEVGVPYTQPEERKGPYLSDVTSNRFKVIKSEDPGAPGGLGRLSVRLRLRS